MTRSVDVLWPSGGAHAVPCGYMPWHVRDNALTASAEGASGSESSWGHGTATPLRASKRDNYTLVCRPQGG